MITNLTETSITLHVAGNDQKTKDWHYEACDKSPSIKISDVDRSKLFDMRSNQTYLDLNFDFDIKELESLTESVRSSLIAKDASVAVVDILCFLALRETHLEDYVVPLNYSQGTHVNVKGYKSFSATSAIKRSKIKAYESDSPIKDGTVAENFRILDNYWKFSRTQWKETGEVHEHLIESPDRVNKLLSTMEANSMTVNDYFVMLSAKQRPPYKIYHNERDDL